jgi:hypothetical protein
MFCLSAFFVSSLTPVVTPCGGANLKAHSSSARPLDAHFLHVLLRRWCWLRPEPLHSLHWLFRRW